MSEVNVVKTEVAEETHVGAVEGRPGVTVVTPENFKEYVDEKLGSPPVEEINPDPEAEGAAELAKIEEEKKAPKEGDVDGSKVFFKGKWVGKHDFAYRLHVQTEAKTKEAEAKIADAAAQARKEREAREAAEKREADLKAKYEPPKGDLGPEPQPEQFTDVREYSKAIKEWTAEKTLLEHNEKQTKEHQEAERVRIAKEWEERVKVFREKNPDAEAKIQTSSVKLSDQAQQAIWESKVGPEILLHFADHPEEGVALGKLTIGKMLREIGRLEGLLGSQAKPALKSEEPPVVEVSKAPEPITPLRGTSAPVGTLRGTDEVPKGMSYDQWKKLWESGKIK